MFLALGCSSVATTGGGGGGVHQGSDGEGWPTLGWGQQRGGGGGVGAIEGEGGQQWGCRQPLRTALHNISISLQNSLS